MQAVQADYKKIIIKLTMLAGKFDFFPLIFGIVCKNHYICRKIGRYGEILQHGRTECG